MSTMGRLTRCCFLIVVCASWSSAAELVDVTIRQIQETTLADGLTSFYNYDDYGDNVNCSSGGIVIRIFPGSIPRLQLYDPNELNGWGVSLYYIIFPLVSLTYIPTLFKLLKAVDYGDNIEKLWMGQGRENFWQIAQYVIAFAIYIPIVAYLATIGYQ